MIIEAIWLHFKSVSNNLYFLYYSPLFQLHNKGPSSISRTVLKVGWPSRFHKEHLLYALQIITDGPVHCNVNGSLNPLELEVAHANSLDLFILIFLVFSPRVSFLKTAKIFLNADVILAALCDPSVSKLHTAGKSHHLLTPHVVQTNMTFVSLFYTKKWISKENHGHCYLYNSKDGFRGLIY